MPLFFLCILRLFPIDLDSPAVVPVDLKQTIQVDEDLQIRAYYAGHVKPLLIHFIFLFCIS